MEASIGYNFVSQLCSTDVAFAEHPGPLSIKCAFNGQEVAPGHLEREILPDLHFLLAPILAIAKIATMVGLFGTVISMINTFSIIGQTGSSQSVTSHARAGLGVPTSSIPSPPVTAATAYVASAVVRGE